MRDRGRGRSGRVPAAVFAGPAGGCARPGCGGAGPMAAPYRAGHPRRRGRHPLWPRLRLCALRAWQIPRHRRRLVGLGGGCGRQSPDRRSGRHQGRGGAGHRADDQPRRGAPPDPRQRHPIDQPGADRGGRVRPEGRHQPGMGRLPDPDLPAGAGHRRRDAAAPRCGAARSGGIRVGAERCRHRQCHFRRDGRALSRAAVYAPSGSGRRCTARPHSAHRRPPSPARLRHRPLARLRHIP